MFIYTVDLVAGQAERHRLQQPGDTGALRCHAKTRQFERPKCPPVAISKVLWSSGTLESVKVREEQKVKVVVVYGRPELPLEFISGEGGCASALPRLKWCWLPTWRPLCALPLFWASRRLGGRSSLERAHDELEDELEPEELAELVACSMTLLAAAWAA